jgi:flagellar basal-body rod modification protein FlgD
VINGVDNSAFSFLNTAANEEVKNEGQGNLLLEDFMALMTTQLQNQDPLKPMDSGDFLGQIASFATVSGIDDLQNSFGSFASTVQSEQALQASSLVGRTVLVPSSIGTMTAEDGLKGQINVAEPVTNLKVQIYNEAGVNVRTIEMGAADGYTNFAWDGLDDNEEALTPGVYQFKASGSIDGENTQFGTATLAKVESVLVGNSNQGLTINLAGIGSVPFKEVQEII